MIVKLELTDAQVAALDRLARRLQVAEVAREVLYRAEDRPMVRSAAAAARKVIDAIREERLRLERREL